MRARFLSVTGMTVIVGAPLLAGPTPAFAQEVAPRYVFEVTPFVGVRFGGTFEDASTGDKLELDEGASAGLMLNWHASANTEYEITWSRQDTDIDLGVDGASFGMTVDYLQIGGTYLGAGRIARPYIVATLGAAYFNPEVSDFSSDTFFAFAIGGGWKLFQQRRFGLRLEGRFYGTVVDGDSKIFCASGAEGSGCLIGTKSDVIWQWEMLLGGVIRF